MTTITLVEPETGQQLTPREAFTVGFPDGMVVTAEHRGHLIRSDQPAAAGGGDSAPAPFDLFLASIATCAGLYALRFCQQRQIPTAGLAVRMVPFKDETRKRIALLDIELTVPPGFPEKYRAAILRAIDQCAVKRHMLEPPDFTIRVA